MAAFNGWDVALLSSLGLPMTKANRSFLQAWQAHEGGTASYNPLNTTQGAQGATSYNSVGVKNFTSAQQGLSATVQTLRNGYYPGILRALQSGNPQWTPELAKNLNTWGTGSGWMKGYKSTKVQDSYPSAGNASSPTTANQPDPEENFRLMLAQQFLEAAGQHRAMTPGAILGLAVARQGIQG